MATVMAMATVILASNFLDLIVSHDTVCGAVDKSYSLIFTIYE